MTLDNLFSVDLRHHHELAETCMKGLADNGGKLPFDKAVDLASRTVDQMIRKYPGRIRTRNPILHKGHLARSTGVPKEGEGDKGHPVAWNHFARYFYFRWPDNESVGHQEAMLALGYDSRHWIFTGQKRVPWRILLSSITADGRLSPDLPDYIEKKLQHRERFGLRDGFTWIYTNQDLKGRDYSFILMPHQDKLPSEDDPDYVSKLADAVFTFLDDLFKP